MNEVNTPDQTDNTIKHLVSDHGLNETEVKDQLQLALMYKQKFLKAKTPTSKSYYTKKIKKIVNNLSLFLDHKE